MNKPGLKEAIEAASASSGIPLSATANFRREDQPIEIRINGLSDLDSFHLSAHRSPMAWIIDIVYDTFSNALIQMFKEQSLQNIEILRNELKMALAQDVLIETNLESLSIAKDSELSNEILNFRFITTPPTNQSTISSKDEIIAFTNLLENALVIVYLLLSKFELDELPIVIGEVEGTRSEKTCGRYSRSVKNKIRCLEKYGYVCLACGLNPSSIYGPIGRNIIHVHHLTPLSLMASESVVNPETDLVPLCPNCHNFAHKRNPPFSLEEIRELLGENRPFTT